MDVKVVFNQMIIIFILMMIGYVMYKKGMLNDISSKHISGLIINLFNPALLISSAISKNRIASTSDILFVTAIAFAMFFLLIAIGLVLPKIIRCPKEDYSSYQLLTIFGNIGFIGIPVTAAVFGTGAVIYTTLFNIPYNFLVYTYGVHLISKKSTGKNKNISRFELRKVLNIGTIASVLAVVVFIVNPVLPAFLTSTVNYLANATTSLSMIVIGVSLAKLPLKNIFTNIRLYYFTIIRLLLIPILASIILKPFFNNPVILGVTILVLSMPCGSLPVLLSQEQGIDNETLSSGVVLTTFLSLATITIISLFV